MALSEGSAMSSSKSSIAVAIALTLLVSAGCASSKPDRHQNVNQFDTDGDGYLTPDEYAESALSDVVAFESLDADGDELLSLAELELRVGRGDIARGSGSRGNKGGRSRGGKPN